MTGERVPHRLRRHARRRRRSSTTSSRSPSIRRRSARASADQRRRSCRRWTTRRPTASAGPVSAARATASTSSGVPVTWAPGQGSSATRPAWAFRSSTTDKLVIQVHYNLVDPSTAGKTDSTTVRLRFASTGEPRARVPAARSVPGLARQRDARLARARPGERRSTPGRAPAPDSASTASRPSIWWPSCRTCTSAASARRDAGPPAA